MTRWLVTGATGLLGGNAGLRLGSDVVGVARRVPATPPFRVLGLDLSSAAQRAGLVERTAPEAILNAAALASIDACEADPELAHVLNTEVAADLAAQAARAGLPFVHISTDAVFDGTLGHYTEDDSPCPTSVYGQTKLTGEDMVMQAHPGAIVARVNFHGWSPTGRRSLSEFFHGRLALGQEVRGFTEVHASGVLHVVSSEPTTKFAFGQAIARTFGYDPALVLPANAADTLAIHRGSHLELSTERAAAILGAPLPGQAAGLERLRAEFDAHLPDVLRTLRAEGA